MVHKFFSSITEFSGKSDKFNRALALNYNQNQPLFLIPLQEIYFRQLWLSVTFKHNLKSQNAALYINHERIVINPLMKAVFYGTSLKKSLLQFKNSYYSVMELLGKKEFQF